MKKSDPVGWLLAAVLYALGVHYLAHWNTGQMVWYGAAGFAGCLMWDTTRLLLRRRKYRRAVSK